MPTHADPATGAQIDDLIRALNHHVDALREQRERERRAFPSYVFEWGYTPSDTSVVAPAQSGNLERITFVLTYCPNAATLQLLGNAQSAVLSVPVPAGIYVLPIGDPGFLIPPDTVRKLTQTSSAGIMMLAMCGYEVPNRGYSGAGSY